MTMSTINPHTGQCEEVFRSHTDEEVEQRIERAWSAGRALRWTSYETRSGWMTSAADLLEHDLESVAAMLGREMGKPVRQARSEVLKSAGAMRFYAANAQGFLADVELQNPSVVDASRATVRYEPMGVILAVMPWNFPLWQVIRFAAPALMAGNVGLLKHASNVPATATYVDSLFTRAGFPEEAFQSLLVPASSVENIVRDPRIAAVTLTGSEPAGRMVGGTAGTEVKKAVLELGGSDPFLVLPSADLAAAAAAAVLSRTGNAGQSCIAAKRFILHTDVHDAFLKDFLRGMSELRMGDPAAEDTDIGPMATEAGRRELDDLVSDAISKGATPLLGAFVPEGPGWFYPPTVLAGVTPHMRIYGEEAFGPVAVVHRAAGTEQMIRLANETRFGLAAAVWTRDPAEESLLTDRLEAGAVFVNGMTVSHPQLPFGGTKTSGIGRELGQEGIQEFCNLKTVWRA